MYFKNNWKADIPLAKLFSSETLFATNNDNNIETLCLGNIE